MFNPKYRILLTRSFFPSDKVVGLGTQLISIVNSIKNFLPQHVWYGADVQAVGKGARKYNLNDIQLNLIGNDSDFIEYCSEIDQFIWGNFACVDVRFLSNDIQHIEIETEDKSFRSIECDGVLLEIRAFDTTYFCIYAEDIKLMEMISELYNVEIERK